MNKARIRSVRDYARELWAAKDANPTMAFHCVMLLGDALLEESPPPPPPEERNPLKPVKT